MPQAENYNDEFDSFEMKSPEVSQYEPIKTTSGATERRRRRAPRQPEPEVKIHEPKIKVEESDEEDEVIEEVKPKKAKKIKKQKMPAGESKKFTSIFAEKRVSIFLGVVLLLFAAYAFISGISFLAYGNPDQSIVENNSMAELSARAGEIKNAGGPAGAVLADFMLTRWLGVGCFVIIAYLTILAISLLRLRKCNFWSLTFKSLVSAIAVSIVAGALSLHAGRVWFWGGEHGYFINQFLVTNTGVWGDLAVNIIMVAALVLIYFDTIKMFFEYVGRQYGKYKESHITEYDDEDDEPEEEFVNQTSKPQAAEQKVSLADKSELITPRSRFKKTEEVDVFEPVMAPAATSTTETNETIAVDTPVVEPQENAEEEPEPATPKMEITAGKIEEADEIATDTYDPTATLSRYKLPPIDLLREIVQKGPSVDQEEQELNKERITRTLNSYGIEIASIKATIGPAITLYEIVPAEGVRISKIKRLGDDMALSLSALGIRIIAPIPGRGTIGMEVPNHERRVVSIRSILSSAAYQNSTAALPIALGTTISNEVYVTDLAKMPHLLVAGATGMGKSVGLNTIIASLLYKKHPAEIKFVMIDPKQVEFSLYSVLERHFLAKLPDEEHPIITESNRVVDTLESLCVEMERRYTLLREACVRDIKSYNQKFKERKILPQNGHDFMPYIVVVVDEFADLMVTVGKAVEPPISRITAKARAVGIHLILATQRPSVNVITGVIKANIPGRIAFRVNQMNDSRTILDRPGAEQLTGLGDMLVSKDGVIERVQGAFIDTDEVESMCEFISNQIGYSTAFILPDPPAPEGATGGVSAGGGGPRDPLFVDAGRFTIESGLGSTTALQRHFTIGFPRAAKIMDQLEAAGVVGPATGGKPRKLLMDIVSFEDYLINNNLR